MKAKVKIIGVFSLLILLSSAYTVYSFRKEITQPPLPYLGQVYDFALTDSEGAPFTLKSLKGQVWIADFFFTTCSDICPIMTKNMGQLQNSLDHRKVKLVSITVNPEQDTSEILDQYAKNNNAKEKNWYFLTGSRKDIREIVLKSFKLGSIEEPIFHSAYFALVDENGLIRGYYNGTDKGEIKRLLKDAALLM